VADRLRWLGHSTVFVELGGTRLLTDPLLRRRLFHLWRPSAVEPEDLAAIDVVLVSHVHYDHLDLPSLRRLSRATRVVVPLGAGRLLRRQGFTSVTEVTAGEQVEVGELVVHAVHADHTSRRLGTKTEPLGYVIAGRRRIYFPGDTDLFPEMGELVPVDVALMPIWGWGPSLGPGHLDPRRAAEALALIRPEIAVPIHWGTYYPLSWRLGSKPVFLEAPATHFMREAAELTPDTEVHVLPVGGTLPL
jgi:L-ascorbate metabolism protein UlaG (beta-lactamase superfamily)